MPRIDHVIESEYFESFRTAQVAGMFDIAPEAKLQRRWQIDMPIEERDWQIGLIAGPSGSGKTQISRAMFGKTAYHNGFVWPRNKAVLDGFAKDLRNHDIVAMLSGVGFSSPPQWLLPFRALSAGQQARAELARLILDKRPLVVCDEYSSTVDRIVAKTMSHAAAKSVRRTDKQFVAVSCHSDILPWLCPDWTYDTASGEFAWRCLQRPPVELAVRRCHADAWRLFRVHHYLSGGCNPSAQCWLATIDDRPVGFIATINFLHAAYRRTKREHRVVVLPDYQGIGIGNQLSEHIAQHYLDMGKRYLAVTSHPAMIGHRIRSALWRLRRAPGMVGVSRSHSRRLRRVHSSRRLTASFEYVGQSAVQCGETTA